MTKNNATAVLTRRGPLPKSLPGAKYGLGAAAAYAVMSSPVAAWAEEVQATTTFDSIKEVIAGGLQAVGAAMVVFGAVTVGMNVSGAAQGNGGAVSAGISTMVGGALVAVAATLFRNITLGV